MFPFRFVQLVGGRGQKSTGKKTTKHNLFGCQGKALVTSLGPTKLKSRSEAKMTEVQDGITQYPSPYPFQSRPTITIAPDSSSRFQRPTYKQCWRTDTTRCLPTAPECDRVPGDTATTPPARAAVLAAQDAGFPTEELRCQLHYNAGSRREGLSLLPSHEAS